MVPMWNLSLKFLSPFLVVIKFSLRNMYEYKEHKCRRLKPCGTWIAKKELPKTLLYYFLQ